MKYSLKNRNLFNKKRIALCVVVVALLSFSIGYSYLETTMSFLASLVTTDNLNNCYTVEILGKKMTACLDNKKSKYVSSSSGINLSNTPSNTNGKGLYILSTTKNDTNPVYYFRGDVQNNNVLFANRCWKMVRTTETGGTKLLYNGTPSTTGILSMDSSLYTNIKNDASYPFEYDSILKTWTSTNHTNSATGTIEFSINTTDNLILKINVSSEPNYDFGSVYIDGTLYGQWSGITQVDVPLSVTPSTVIKVSYRKDASVDKNNDNVVFTIGKSDGSMSCDNIGETVNLNKSSYANSSTSGNISAVGYMYKSYQGFSDKQISSSGLSSANDNFSISTTYNNYSTSYLYYFSDSYTYSNGTYTLGDDAQQKQWSTYYSDLIGKYSCLTTSKTCSTLKYVYDGTETAINYVNVTTPNVSTVPGESDGEETSDPVTVVEYIFDPSNLEGLTTYTKSVTSYNYYFATDVTYDGSKYVLTDPVKIGHWSDIYNTVANKGYFSCLSAKSTSCTTVDYILSGTSTSVKYFPLSDGRMIDDENVNLYFASSYEKNEDDTYTLVNPTSVKREDWSNTTIAAGSYFCSNPKNTTCENLEVLAYQGESNYYYFMNEDWKFASSVEWDGTAYTLSDDNITYTTSQLAANPSLIARKHYTCFNTSDSCEDIYYHLGSTSTSAISSLYYYIIKGGEKNPYEVLMSDTDDRNKNDSKIKELIDNSLFGTSGFLTSYIDYLEDTPYSNCRNLDDKKGLLPSGVGYGWSYNNDSSSFYCINQLDNFTVSKSNGNGALTYPVGLITYNEARLAGKVSYIDVGSSFWTMTAVKSNYVPYVYYINDGFKTSSVGSSYGVRPMISLKNTISISSGDGSPSSPYIID